MSYVFGRYSIFVVEIYVANSASKKTYPRDGVVCVMILFTIKRSHVNKTKINRRKKYTNKRKSSKDYVSSHVGPYLIL